VKWNSRQTASSRDNRIHNAADDRLIFYRSDDPGIQKLSLCEHKWDVHECQEVRPETDYITRSSGKN
jgi:hypothetical protein